MKILLLSAMSAFACLLFFKSFGNGPHELPRGAPSLKVDKTDPVLPAGVIDSKSTVLSFKSRFLELVSDSFPPKERKLELSHLWKIWGKSDPIGAFNYVVNSVPSVYKAQAFRDLFRTIASHSASEAEQLLHGVPDGYMNYALHGFIIGGMENSPDFIRDWISSEANARLITAELCGLVSERLVSKGGLGQIHAFIAKSDNMPLSAKSDIYSTGLALTARLDPNLALQSILTAPDEEYTHGAALEEALPSLLKAKGGSYIMETFSNVPSAGEARAAAILQWAVLDPNQAGTWLNQHAQDNDAANLIDEFCQYIAHIDPEAAVKWAKTITGDEPGDDLLHMILGTE